MRRRLLSGNGRRSAAGKGGAKLVPKPWGHELWFAETQRYVGKLLVIEKGRRLSLQYHKVKHESLYVLRGVLTLHLNGRVQTLRSGGAFTVPPRMRHRFEARHGRVTLIEVSTPETWDIVRLQDDYVR